MTLSYCLSKKQHWPAHKLAQYAEQSQITARLTTGHFKQVTTIKRKPGTNNSHEFMVLATSHVIPLIHKKKLPLSFPEEK